ncbi:serine hydrolase domain-containing protein [Saccharibacillus sacchari]|uniref:Serine hydrolase domain-containing protein n=1 Tax=Saccharibacillus sacchari TaxID=456493 RepID=A0ACC6PC33_9BACL
MDAVKHSLETHKKLLRWASLPEHTPAIGWIVRGEKMYWTPQNGVMDSRTYMKKNKKQPQSLYEIGSITKTMTALRLAQGEQDGLWQASDPLSKLVPELADSEFARSVTLRQLATHTSGLARLAKNQVKVSMQQNKANPYAAYFEQHLLQAVREESPRSGAKHGYSNYGYGLLGWALSRASGITAPDALRRDLFDPLEMRGTVMPIVDDPQADNDAKSDRKATVTSREAVPHSNGADPTENTAAATSDSVVGSSAAVSDSAQATSSSAVATLTRVPVATEVVEAPRPAPAAPSKSPGTILLPGFAPGGHPMPHWDFTSAMAGAGAVRSTLPDMLTYLEAQLGQHPSAASFEAALLACQHEQASVALSKGVGIGYAWMRSMRQDGTVTHWHNGATYGASSFMAFNRDLQSGFVILSNRGVSMMGQLKQMFGLGEMSTDRAAKLIGEALFNA